MDISEEEVDAYKLITKIYNRIINKYPDLLTDKSLYTEDEVFRLLWKLNIYPQDKEGFKFQWLLNIEEFKQFFEENKKKKDEI